MYIMKLKVTNNPYIGVVVVSILVIFLFIYFHTMQYTDTIKWNQHYYINLDHREDRRQNVRKELKGLGISNPNRFPAIKNELHGGIGCGMSHVGVLKNAKQKGWDYVIVMEDDIVFHDPEETKRKINRVINSDITWDVIIVGSVVSEPTEYINDDCVRALGGMITAIMYIVKRHYYDTLIDLWSKDMHSFQNAILQNSGRRNETIDAIYGKYAIDQTWKKLQKRDTFLSIIPHKVWQFEENNDSNIWNTHYE